MREPTRNGGFVQTRPDGLVEGWKVFREGGNKNLWSCTCSGGNTNRAVEYKEKIWSYPHPGAGPLTFFGTREDALGFCAFLTEAYFPPLKYSVRRVFVIPWLGKKDVWEKGYASISLDSLTSGTALAAAIKVLPEEKAQDHEADQLRYYSFLTRETKVEAKPLQVLRSMKEIEDELAYQEVRLFEHQQGGRDEECISKIKRRVSELVWIRESAGLTKLKFYTYQPEKKSSWQYHTLTDVMAGELEPEEKPATKADIRRLEEQISNVSTWVDSMKGTLARFDVRLTKHKP